MEQPFIECPASILTKFFSKRYTVSTRLMVTALDSGLTKRAPTRVIVVCSLWYRCPSFMSLAVLWCA